jgi:hypothetical protein
MTKEQEQNEVWVPITGYEGLYDISSLGRVKSKRRVVKSIRSGRPLTKTVCERILIPTFCNEYAEVCLNKNGSHRSAKVHILIAKAFLPNPDNKPILNHINGVKSDYQLLNLEWTTYKENTRHAWDTKLCTAIKGTQSGNSKLTDESILEIKERFKNGENNAAIAKIYNVSKNNIRNIRIGKAWKHVA